MTAAIRLRKSPGYLPGLWPAGLVRGKELREVAVEYLGRQRQLHGGFWRVGRKQARVDCQRERGTSSPFARTHDASRLSAGELPADKGLPEEEEHAVAFRPNRGIDDADVVLDSPLNAVHIENSLHERDLVDHDGQREVAKLPEGAFAQVSPPIVCA